MQIKAIEPFRFQGEHVAQGQVLTVSVDDAKNLIRLGRALAVTGEEAAEPAAEETGAGYATMKKDDLLNLALARGLAVDASFKKAELISALEASNVLTTEDGAAVIEGGNPGAQD